MKMTNIDRVSNSEFNEWLCCNIPDITADQELLLTELLTDRACPYFFYKKYEPKAHLIMRFTLFPFILFWLLLVLSMPINYLITGRFRYNNSKLMEFFEKWLNAVFH